ncbi:DMT family transporter [Haloglycomyces albus]|uniref:DMT family transporter n=1 Tax=Haloglycomyces albus TaxID=526067 RepID=UPI00046D3FED|nr:DMT family transporter [Haloglycomyces albus]
MAQKHAGVLRVLVLASIWGSAFMWVEISLEGFTPMQITFIRLGLGALALITVLAAMRMRLPSGWRTWGHLAIAALFGNVIPYSLFALGQETVPSSIAGVVNASTPLWTALLTILAYRKGSDAKSNGLSLLIGFAGVLLIYSPWNQGTFLFSWGALYCLGATVSYAISYLYIGRFLAKEKSKVIPMATGQMTCAAIIAIPVAAFSNWSLDIPLSAVGAVSILGILSTGLAYILNYRIITDDGPTAASIVSYLLPAVAVILGVALLREPILLQVALGLALIFIAMWLRRPTSMQQKKELQPVRE